MDGMNEQYLNNRLKGSIAYSGAVLRLNADQQATIAGGGQKSNLVSETQLSF